MWVSPKPSQTLRAVSCPSAGLNHRKNQADPGWGWSPLAKPLFLCERAGVSQHGSVSAGSSCSSSAHVTLGTGAMAVGEEAKVLQLINHSQRLGDPMSEGVKGGLSSLFLLHCLPALCQEHGHRHHSLLCAFVGSAFEARKRKGSFFHLPLAHVSCSTTPHMTHRTHSHNSGYCRHTKFSWTQQDPTFPFLLSVCSFSPWAANWLINNYNN